MFNGPSRNQSIRIKNVLLHIKRHTRKTNIESNNNYCKPCTHTKAADYYTNVGIVNVIAHTQINNIRMHMRKQISFYILKCNITLPSPFRDTIIFHNCILWNKGRLLVMKVRMRSE